MCPCAQATQRATRSNAPDCLSRGERRPPRATPRCPLPPSRAARAYELRFVRSTHLRLHVHVHCSVCAAVCFLTHLLGVPRDHRRCAAGRTRECCSEVRQCYASAAQRCAASLARRSTLPIDVVSCATRRIAVAMVPRCDAATSPPRTLAPRARGRGGAGDYGSVPPRTASHALLRSARVHCCAHRVCPVQPTSCAPSQPSSVFESFCSCRRSGHHQGRASTRGARQQRNRQRNRAKPSAKQRDG